MTAFKSSQHLGKLIRKPRCSLFWCRQETTLRILTSCPSPSPLWKPQASALPCLLKSLLDLLLKPALPSPQGLFIPFWCVCGIFHLSILTKFGWRSTLLLQCGHNSIGYKIYYQSFLSAFYMLFVCSKYCQKDFIIILLFPSAK